MGVVVYGRRLCWCEVRVQPDEIRYKTNISSPYTTGSRVVETLASCTGDLVCDGCGTQKNQRPEQANIPVSYSKIFSLYLSGRYDCSVSAGDGSTSWHTAVERDCPPCKSLYPLSTAHSNSPTVNITQSLTDLANVGIIEQARNSPTRALMKAKLVHIESSETNLLPMEQNKPNIKTSSTVRIRPSIRNSLGVVQYDGTPSNNTPVLNGPPRHVGALLRDLKRTMCHVPG